MVKLPHRLYDDFVSLIVKSLKIRLSRSPVSVVLFGSVARGEADEGSDVDLLVVSDGFKGSFGERFRLFQSVE